MNIQNIDLNLLRVLDALLREQHVSRAANALHLSQPATSAALARLRDALGDPLLVRTARGMQPTERAIQLAPQLRALLENIAVVLLPPVEFDPRQTKMIFNVAATDYFVELTNRKLAQRLSNESPNIQFAWRPLIGAGLIEKMQSAQYDVAITNRARVPGSLHVRSLMKESFVGIANKKNKRIKAKAPMALDTFCKLPHVLVSPTGVDPFHGATDDALAARGLARQVAFSVPQFRFAIDIVDSTDAIAVFPAKLAAQYRDRITQFALPIALSSFDIAMSWHERTHRSPPHQWLRKQLLELVK